MKKIYSLLFTFTLLSSLALAQDVKEKDKKISKSNCDSSYLNQIKSLRNAQLMLQEPQTGETLFELKNKHDKDAAALILLKGLQKIREQYEKDVREEEAKARLITHVENDINEIKKMATDAKGKLQSTERMLVLEKGIELLAGEKNNYKSEMEFIQQIESKCRSNILVKSEFEDQTTLQVCEILSSDSKTDMTNMLTGFYRAYKVSGGKKSDATSYLNYLQIVANQSDLSLKLDSKKSFIEAIDKASTQLQECSKKKTACALDAKEIQKAYTNYKQNLEDQFSQSSQVLKNAGQDSSTQKDFSNFTKKVQELNDFKKLSQTELDAEVSKNYDATGTKLADLANITNATAKDFAPLLKNLNCDSALFSKKEALTASQRDSLKTCLLKTSKEALSKMIDDKNKAIEATRAKIQSFSKKPSWWKNDLKYNFKTYDDLSYAIDYVAKKMVQECSNVKELGDPYETCALDGLTAPESLKTLSISIDQVETKIQTTTLAEDPKRNRAETCLRLKDAGYRVPVAMCHEGFKGDEKVLSLDEKSKLASSLTEIAQEATPEVQKKSKKQETQAEKRKNEIGQGEQKSSSQVATRENSKSSFSRGAVKKNRGNLGLFMDTLSNDQNFWSMAMGWASLDGFRGQVLYQSEVAKGQIVAEKYQQAWTDYYTQVQENSWLNFLNTQQYTSLYNGGVYYNFTGTN